MLYSRDMKRPVLYIMVGYPGSGKTTVAQLIHEVTGARHLWADQERQARFHHPPHGSEESRKLYDQLNQEVTKMLVDGQSVIYDTGFSFRRDRQHMRELAKKAKADCKLIWVQVPRDLAKTRAVQESEGKPTRLWGNMSEADFNRMADNLHPPEADEKPITIHGVGVDEARVRHILGLK